MITEILTPGDPVGDILFNWLPFLGVAAVGVVGVFLMMLGFRTYVKAAWLRKSGIKGHAVVTEKWIKKGYVDREERHRTKPLKYHYLRFERSNNGKTYSEKEVAPIDLWRDVEPGDEVEVIYLPGGALMRLSGWSHTIGHGARVVQMVAGALMGSASVSMIIPGAVSAMIRPDYKTTAPDWIPEQAEVLRIGDPADPYLRLFAPNKKYIRVVFGDTHGGAFMANTRMVLVTQAQIEEFQISDGTILAAWMDPQDEYNAILDLERDPALR